MAELPYRNVAQTSMTFELGRAWTTVTNLTFRVSTAWIPDADTEFETVLLWSSDLLEPYTRRYSTEAEALQGHRKLVKLLFHIITTSLSVRELSVLLRKGTLIRDY